MNSFNWTKTKAKRTPCNQFRAGRVRLDVETLESRVVPYAASGNAWPHPELITISFVPDGTNIEGHASDMQSVFNTKFGSTAAWQNVFMKAAQVWAEQTNINFVFVSDNGVPVDSGDNQQGDPGFGDIRIGGYSFTSYLADAAMPPPINNFAGAGDITFNTSAAFHINATYDLFSVAAHEIGHALGLYHGAANSVMASVYSGTFTGLTTDDINGIRNIYSANAPRAQDSYDTAAANGTFATATDITSTISTTAFTALVPNMDLSTRTDVDWYKITIPSGSSTTLTARAVATGLSLLDPKIEIYNSSNVLKATGNGAAYGSTASASFTGIADSQVWYIKVSSIDATLPFRTGKYALVLNMGTNADPTVTLPNTLTPNGIPFSVGGGQALAIADETLVNTTTFGNQTLNANGQPAIGMDAVGNYVVVWSSQNQDTRGSWGVYAQRFDASGAAVGNEFRVNATTAGDQLNPTVAMNANGAFVVSWTSVNQGVSDVYAQRYDASGTAQGSEFKVNATNGDSHVDPSVAIASNGDFVVSWSSYNQDARNSWGIYARRYNAAGVAQGAEFKVNTTTADDQQHASAVMDSNGDFVISWSSHGQDTNDSWGVYAQRFQASGQALGGEFRINTTTAGDQQLSSTAMDAKGNFVAIWTSSGQDGSGLDVYGQQYDDNGVAIGREFLVNSTTRGDQSNAAVAFERSGSFIVTWTSKGQDGNDSGIFAQQFSSMGMPVEDEFAVNTIARGDQDNSSVALDRLGHMVIVWNGNGPGDASGVFARHYSIDADFLEIPVAAHGHGRGSAFDDASALHGFFDGERNRSGLLDHFGWTAHDDGKLSRESIDWLLTRTHASHQA